MWLGCIESFWGLMRYIEDKEQSSELLRLALPLMGRQAAAYHPVSYSIWYEHVGGLNPPLSEVLTARLAANEPLTEEDVYRLHARHIYTRDVKMVESLQQRLLGLLEDTAQTAAAAGEDTGRYGRALRQSRSALTEAASLEAMRQVIAQLVSETVRMEVSTLALSEKLEIRSKEVNALTEQLERMQTEALLDPLCGLNNRRGFERAAQEIAESDGELNGAALLLADVDHFKQVNDTHGHLLGDKVLRTIAQTMRSSIKGRDIAARIGGDEFAILLPQTPLHGAAALAEQLRLAVAGGHIRRGNGTDFVGSITLSIGVAAAHRGETFESLMERTDAALYGAKRNGRNRVSVAARSESAVAE
jgi:diguanylate cyclase